MLRRDFEPLGGGATIADNLNAYGRTYEYNDAGLIARMSNIDAQGRILVSRSGTAARRNKYDAHGDLVEAQWHNALGHLTANELQIAAVTLTHDDVGNVLQEDYLTQRTPLLVERIGGLRV